MNYRTLTCESCKRILSQEELGIKFNSDNTSVKICPNCGLENFIVTMRAKDLKGWLVSFPVV